MNQFEHQNPHCMSLKQYHVLVFTLDHTMCLKTVTWTCLNTWTSMYTLFPLWLRLSFNISLSSMTYYFLSWLVTLILGLDTWLGFSILWIDLMLSFFLLKFESHPTLSLFPYWQPILNSHLSSQTWSLRVLRLILSLST